MVLYNEMLINTILIHTKMLRLSEVSLKSGLSKESFDEIIKARLHHDVTHHHVSK